MEKEVSAIDQLFDENNTENIVLYDEDNNPAEFEQVAIIPFKEKVYAILKPVDMAELADDEALVFVIDEMEGQECLVIVEEDTIVDGVFKAYYDLIKEENK